MWHSHSWLCQVAQAPPRRDAWAAKEAFLPITVRIPPPLRRYTGGVELVQFAASRLPELFDGLEQRFPGIKQALCGPDGSPQRFLNIYVNDEDIRFLGGAQYSFREGDEVLLVPAIAGGIGCGTQSVLRPRGPVPRHRG